MRKLVDDMIAKHAIAIAEAATYGLQIERVSKEGAEFKCNYKRVNELWPYAIQTVERGKVARDSLQQIGDFIRQTIGWDGPVDSLTVYAYIARSQNNEAIVEEKRKREESNEGTSTKRVTRGIGRKEAEQSHGASPQDIPPPEVSMEDVPKEKKHESSKGKSKPPAYKLQSDIELATDVRKVLEERILNSKVEFTLGEVLGCKSDYRRCTG